MSGRRKNKHLADDFVFYQFAGRILVGSSNTGPLVEITGRDLVMKKVGVAMIRRELRNLPVPTRTLWVEK